MSVQSSLSIAAELGISLRVADSFIDRHFYFTKQAIVGHYLQSSSSSSSSSSSLKIELR